MLGIKKIALIVTKSGVSKWAKLALAMFGVQFFGAAYLLYYEISESTKILSAPMGMMSEDLIIYHYFRLALLTPIVGLSAIYSITGFLTKWDFDFEQELVEVFIFIGWVVFGLISIFMR